MVEHNFPQLPTSPSSAPLPVALYVSGELIFELHDGGHLTGDFRSVGSGSFERRKASQRQSLRVPQRARAPPSVNTNLAIYATAFLGASAVVRFAVPFPRKFSSS
jgi:hypothetical protein